MKLKILSGIKARPVALKRITNGITTDNIVVPAITLKRVSFGPRSAGAEYRPNNISTKADGSGEPKKRAKISGLIEIN